MARVGRLATARECVVTGDPVADVLELLLRWTFAGLFAGGLVVAVLLLAGARD